MENSRDGETKSGVASARKPESPDASRWVRYSGKVPPHRAWIDGEDIFQPFVEDHEVEIVEEIEKIDQGDIVIRRLLFRSLVVDGENQDVFASICTPKETCTCPGVLFVHGGSGSALECKAIEYAQKGYIAVAPDLPGIADPGLCRYSTGAWKQLSSAEREMLRWSAEPDGRASIIFDAVVAGLQAFSLLRAQPGVTKDKIGIYGMSWGGYMTLMLSGLLGDRVEASFSALGCGFYDVGTYRMRDNISKMPIEQQSNWLRDLDAGRRIGNLKAKCLIAASTVDFAFWPPAVNATYGAILGEKYIVYSSKNSHDLSDLEGETHWFGDDYLARYFDYHLMGLGHPFPTVHVEEVKHGLGGNWVVSFSVDSVLPVTSAKLYYSSEDKEWPDRGPWVEVVAEEVHDRHYRAILPAHMGVSAVDWYVRAADSRPVSASSIVYRCTI